MRGAGCSPRNRPRTSGRRSPAGSAPLALSLDVPPWPPIIMPGRAPAAPLADPEAAFEEAEPEPAEVPVVPASPPAPEAPAPVPTPPTPTPPRPRPPRPPAPLAPLASLVPAARPTAPSPAAPRPDRMPSALCPSPRPLSTEGPCESGRYTPPSPSIPGRVVPGLPVPSSPGGRPPVSVPVLGRSGYGGFGRG